MAQEDRTPGGEPQRMRNFGAYYKGQGWPGGPAFFIFNSGLYGQGTPLPNKGIHSPSFNNNSLGWEMVGDFRPGVDNPRVGKGFTVFDGAAFGFAVMLDHLGKPANNDTIKLHKEDRKTSHDCPGSLVIKSVFIERVKFHMAALKRKGTPVPQETKTEVAPAAEPKYKWVHTPVNDPLNLREKPGSGFAVKGFLPAGLKVQVLGEQGSWAFVRTPFGAEGWCSAAYLKEFPPVTMGAANPPKPADVPAYAADLHVSPKGLALIKSFEGEMLTAYDDNGSWAIGFGHSNRSERPPVVYEGMKITKEMAELIFRDDIEKGYAPAVRKAIKAKVTQSQFDALVSLGYNKGTGWLARSALMKAVNAGDHKTVERLILEAVPAVDSRYHPGILRRRKAELKRYRNED